MSKEGGITKTVTMNTKKSTNKNRSAMSSCSQPILGILMGVVFGRAFREGGLQDSEEFSINVDSAVEETPHINKIRGEVS